MTWTSGTNLITCTASDSIDGATGLSAVTELNTEHRVYFIDTVQVVINSGQTWSDTNSIIIHKQYASLMAYSTTATSHIEFGAVDKTTPTKPVITDGCVHHVDLNGAGASYDNWWDPDDEGNYKIWGGALQAEPFPSDVGAGFAFVYFPNDRVELIGVNWIRFGGCRHYGTDYRIQEVKVGGNNQWGYGSQLTNDSLGILRLTYYGGAHCYYLVSTQTVDSTFKDVSIRGADDTATTSAWANTATIINSDEITSIDTSTFNTGGEIIEQTTYDVHCQDEDGDDIQSVNCRIVRTLRAAGSGSFSTDTGTGNLAVPYQIALKATDSGGDLTQTDLIQRYWADPSYETISTRLRFGGFYITIRKYGYAFEDISVAPQLGAGNALVQNYILKENTFITETTQATVDAYTGISVNYSTQTLTISSDHTIQEIYDFCQSYATKDAQMPYEAAGAVFTENSGIPGASNASPLTTADGLLFTLDSEWSLVGESYIDINGAIFELPNGDRWVPIALTGVEAGSSYWINQTGGSVLYSGVILDDGNNEFSTQRKWTQSDINVTVRVRLQGFQPFDQTATITNGGLSIAVNSTEDGLYKYYEGRIEQTHFWWRDDDGSESAASGYGSPDADEDENITGLVKQTNVRLRIQLDEIREKPNTVTPKLQYRKVGDALWEDVGGG